jgi:hypothetical protein
VKVARVARAWCLGLSASIVSSACREPSGPDVSLAFVRDGKAIQSFTFERMRKITEPEVVTTRDPYYQATKRFRALYFHVMARHKHDPAQRGASSAH